MGIIQWTAGTTCAILTTKGVYTVYSEKFNFFSSLTTTVTEKLPKFSDQITAGLDNMKQAWEQTTYFLKWIIGLFTFVAMLNLLLFAFLCSPVPDSQDQSVIFNENEPVEVVIDKNLPDGKKRRQSRKKPRGRKISHASRKSRRSSIMDFVPGCNRQRSMLPAETRLRNVQKSVRGWRRNFNNKNRRTGVAKCELTFLDAPSFVHT